MGALGRSIGRAAARSLTYLATGWIFLFYSERMFWARWRPGEDGAASLLVTWIVYSIAAAACLLAIRRFRVRALWPMFLVGAMLGWLVEGVFTMTFFGADGIPFPLTIAWTGLSWHALIAVVAGWYGLHRAMQHSLARTALACAGLGLFWGIWSIYWDRVAPPPPPEDFLLHAVSATFGAMVAFRSYPLLRVGQLRVGRIECLVLGVLVLGYFVLVTLATFNWIALVTLPPLFALIWAALRRNARVEQAQDFLDELARPVPWSRSLALLVMPVVATLVHEGCRAGGLSAPTNLMVFFVTLPAGFALFVVSLAKLFRRPPAGASAASR